MKTVKGTAGEGAFSLVEIVLAIGIVSFALMAMLGLVSVSLQSDRSSASDTDLAALSQQVISTLRSQPFTNLSGTNFFFDSDGSLTTNSSGAVYECAVTLTADPLLPAASFKNARLQFTWPVSATNRPNTNVFLSGIANYGN
jgi:uncharacterized protein (TIGR02598 family)